MHYYNDNNLEAAEWLRELMKAGFIPAGEIDTRSICDVQADDVSGFTQCHFFAGIGGWCEALRLAGWPKSWPVWTGSCPCQPFSAAGKQLGEKDERHLWPEFFRLIQAVRPLTVFGEQVERAISHGWLDGVFADLEGENYSTGAAVLGTHSVGAPGNRPRLYWMGDAVGSRLERHARHGNNGDKPRRNNSSQARPIAPTGGHGYWNAYDLLRTKDGKARRIESGSFPLADGFPGRVGLIRGYGNAINPYVAAEFIGAYLDTEREQVT